jgi:hypothetical protein
MLMQANIFVQEHCFHFSLLSVKINVNGWSSSLTANASNAQAPVSRLKKKKKKIKEARGGKNETRNSLVGCPRSRPICSIISDYQAQCMYDNVTAFGLE